MLWHWGLLRMSLSASQTGSGLSLCAQLLAYTLIVGPNCQTLIVHHVSFWVPALTFLVDWPET